MAVTQLVLTGVPAYVGVVTGSTTVRFFIDDNDFDPAHLIDVDLAKDTSLPPASWATAVDVDQQTTGGLTTIGPKFHRDGRHAGAVYLAERLVTARAAALASWPPPPDARYQYQAVLRDVDGTTTRYHGFKVQVLSPAVGSIAHLAVIRTGASSPAVGDHVRWIDLADPETCDPIANGFTTIDATSTVGTVGALFLTSTAIGVQAMDHPKVPRSLGW
jgi:hypothetical protein